MQGHTSQYFDGGRCPINDYEVNAIMHKSAYATTAKGGGGLRHMAFGHSGSISQWLRGGWCMAMYHPLNYVVRCSVVRAWVASLDFVGYSRRPPWPFAFPVQCAAVSCFFINEEARALSQLQSLACVVEVVPCWIYGMNKSNCMTSYMTIRWTRYKTSMTSGKSKSYIWHTYGW